MEWSVEKRPVTVHSLRIQPAGTLHGRGHQPWFPTLLSHRSASALKLYIERCMCLGMSATNALTWVERGDSE